MAFTITEACQGCQACVRICPAQAISGEKKAVHRINLQRCIECGVCGRVCPYNAVLAPDNKPAEHIKQSAWFQPKIDQKKCVSCGLCIISCPVNCLDLDDHNGRILPESYPCLKRPNDCIGCGFCETICPVAAIEMAARKKKIEL
jgi:electron transport complex protein RnfB